MSAGPASEGSEAPTRRILPDQSGGHHYEPEQLDKSIHTKEFDQQLQKWAHHHSLPNWSIEQMKVHLEHETQRRKKHKKLKVSAKNIMKPWKWNKVWHHNHLHTKGDIMFPDADSHDHTAQPAPLPQHLPARKPVQRDMMTPPSPPMPQTKLGTHQGPGIQRRPLNQPYARPMTTSPQTQSPLTPPRPFSPVPGYSPQQPHPASPRPMAGRPGPRSQISTQSSGTGTATGTETGTGSGTVTGGKPKGSGKQKRESKKVSKKKKGSARLGSKKKRKRGKKKKKKRDGDGDDNQEEAKNEIEEDESSEDSEDKDSEEGEDKDSEEEEKKRAKKKNKQKRQKSKETKEPKASASKGQGSAGKIALAPAAVKKPAVRSIPPSISSSQPKPSISSSQPKPTTPPHSSGSRKQVAVEDIESCTFMTDDLVVEIMNDLISEDPQHIVIDHADPKPISPWSTIEELWDRDHLFTKEAIHENRVRSIALCNPKPGDPRPGPTKLKTNLRIGFLDHMYVCNIDTNQNGVLSKAQKKLQDYKK